MSGSGLRIARDAVPAVLETPRLRLVASDKAFAPAFAAAIAASSAELGFVAAWRAAADVEVAARSLQTSIDLAADDVVRHAFDRESGAYVARLDLHSWDDDVPLCELGYLAATPMTGRGLVTEACRAMLDLAWSMGVVRVQATCDPRNTAAVRLAERLGMVHEGVRIACERDESGRLCDEVLLAAVRRDDVAPTGIGTSNP